MGLVDCLEMTWGRFAILSFVAFCPIQQGVCNNSHTNTHVNRAKINNLNPFFRGALMKVSKRMQKRLGKKWRKIVEEQERNS